MKSPALPGAREARALRCGPPCQANGWHWGGPCPKTHRYHNVDRGDGLGMPYQRDESCSIGSAAVIFLNCDVGGYSAGDGSGPYGYGDAHYWFTRAVRGGIVFG